MTRCYSRPRGKNMTRFVYNRPHDRGSLDLQDERSQWRNYRIGKEWKPSADQNLCKGLLGQVSKESNF